MSQHKASTDRSLGQLLCSPECEREEFVCSGSECTGHDTPRTRSLSRTGRWTYRRRADESLPVGCAPQVSRIQNNSGGDFLLLGKRRKEGLYATHSCQHHCGGGSGVGWESNGCR